MCLIDNTDGQLGDASVQMCSPSMIHLREETFEPPLPPTPDDPVVGVAAGGDSSLLWTASGRVWAWGNSEYGQCLVGGQAIDQIRTPTEATEDLSRSISGKVVDVRFGGSFVVILDGELQSRKERRREECLRVYCDD
jgi:alpha-tubulin suppressor-like RCC1 family protein